MAYEGEDIEKAAGSMRPRRLFSERSVVISCFYLTGISRDKVPTFDDVELNST